MADGAAIGNGREEMSPPPLFPLPLAIGAAGPPRRLRPVGMAHRALEKKSYGASTAALDVELAPLEAAVALAAHLAFFITSEHADRRAADGGRGPIKKKGGVSVDPFLSAACSEKERCSAEVAPSKPTSSGYFF